MEEKMVRKKRRKEEEKEWKKKKEAKENIINKLNERRIEKLFLKSTCIERKMCKFVAHQWKRTIVKRKILNDQGGNIWNRDEWRMTKSFLKKRECSKKNCSK